MSGAAAALRAAAREALSAIGGFGLFDAAPGQAAFPYVVLECGPETDWGHKSGAGRELRMAAAVRDRGEAPERLEAIAQACETELCAMSGVVDGWQLVSLRHLRTRTARERDGWIAAAEFRARMLKV